MKSGIKALLAVVVVVALIAAGVLWGPLLVYKLPPFQAWVSGQIESQSGGTFSFDSIEGDLSEAYLTNAVLSFESGEDSNLVAVEMPRLRAGFTLLPLLTLQLKLTDLESEGGKVHLKLSGGDVSQIRFPVDAGQFRMTGGTLLVENVHGYRFELKPMELEARPDGEGMAGTFNGESATIREVVISAVSGNFQFSSGQLSVSDFSGTLPGDSPLALSGTLSLNDNQPLENVDLSVATEDVAGLLGGLGYSGAFGGNAKVAAQFSGYHRPELKNLDGKGTYTLSDISAVVGLPKYPGFDETGILKRLKKIEGLAGEGEFILAADRIRLPAFEVRNSNMVVVGDVDTGLDRSLGGKLTFKASPDLEDEFPSVVRNVFDRDAQRWILVPFEFQGRTDAPAVKTDSVITKALTNPANAVKAVGETGKGILGIFGIGGGKKAEEAAE